MNAALQTVCLLFGGPDRIITVNGKTWRFEDHPYCGPMTVGKNGDPVKEPHERSPFWDAVTLWYAQGKRTQQIGNETWCVWEKPTMRKTRHLVGRHYELVLDNETLRWSGMLKCKVKTPEDALVYMADCTLATVSSMASKKSRSEYDFDRQISIAQTAIDWIVEMDVVYTGRVQQAISAGGAREWSKKFMPGPNTDKLYRAMYEV